MEGERYWFEDVPEGERYWFVSEWGMPPALEAEGKHSDLPRELEAELEDIEDKVRAKSIWGIDPDELHEIRKMQERMDAAGYAPGALRLPGRTDAEGVGSRLNTPQLFTTKEGAEELRDSRLSRLMEDYQEHVEEHGKSDVDEALDNTAPLRAVWTDRNSLIEGLEESDSLSVMVDGKLRLRQDLIGELRGRRT